MMRGFPHFEERARPRLEPRVCAARAARPMSVRCGFLFSSPIKSHQCDLQGDLVMVVALAKRPYRLFSLMLEPKALVASLLFFGLVF